MARIDITKWKEYRIGNLFTFQRIYQAKSQALIPTADPSENSDCVPYVVQSRLNNMVSRYVDRQWLIDHDEPPVKGNAIVLGVTLNACSYQPEEFGASQVITARSPYLTKYSGFFIATVLKRYIEKYSYREKPGLKKYKELMIKLPACADGTPDWNFMEEYMRQIEAKAQSTLAVFESILYNK